MDGIQVRHLTLDDLTVNPRLARRLPPAVACRCHALPVAEENGHITVVMADPDDAVAREAIANALGAPSSVVGGDSATIDALLTEVWPEVLQGSPRLLVCAHASPIADEVLTFSRALGSLLGAHVSYFSPLVEDDANCEAVARVAEQSGYSLVIWGEPDQSLGQRLLTGAAHRKATKRVTCSLLVARRPRWPLRSMLLIVRGEETDNVATDWVVRLARPSRAVVTVLTVVPPVPAMYNGYARMRQGLDTLLTTDTALGKHMRWVAQWLVEWELEVTLRLRQGAPDQEIRREVTQGDYDLIALADQPRSKWRRWLVGDWVTSLLSWAERPVLIAKPTKV
jgi:nucleotide-binding universal stress UspA family protein